MLYLSLKFRLDISTKMRYIWHNLICLCLTNFSFLFMAQYYLDQESLKSLGVPEDFEKLFDQVFEGDDGNIYILKNNKMHLLVKGPALLLPIEQRSMALPKAIAGFKEKLSPFALPLSSTKVSKELDAYTAQSKGISFAFVIEGCFPPKVFAKTPGGYEELPPTILSRNFSTLLCKGKMLLRNNDKYFCVDLMPVFAQKNYVIFWAGGRGMFFAHHTNKSLCFTPLGTFEKLTMTSVSNLIEVRPFFRYSRDLYHLAEDLSMIDDCADSFSISKKTGTVTTHYGIYTVAFICQNGKYKRKT